MLSSSGRQMAHRIAPNNHHNIMKRSITRFISSSSNRNNLASIAPLSGSTTSRLTSSSQQRYRLPDDSIRISPYKLSSPRRWSSSSSSSLQDDGLLDEIGLLRFDTLHEMTRNASVAFAPNELFGTYDPSDKAFHWMTYAEFGAKVDRCRAVLVELGIREHDKIGIISNNRWEWACIAAASYSLNATLVPMYEAQHPKDWLYILNDSQCSALFCATQEIFETVRKDVEPAVPTLQATLCLDAEKGEEYAFQTVMEGNSSDNVVSPIIPTSDDLANLVYTSGTTGRPKGVELTHHNAVSNLRGINRMVLNPHNLVNSSDRSLAFLPWAHSYGQTCELWCLMSHGASLGVCRGITHILEDLGKVTPTVLFSVPTLYKRVYDGVMNLMEGASPVRKRLMGEALVMGRKKYLAKDGSGGWNAWDNVKHKALDSLVLSKIRGRFGGRLRHGFCAGAAVPREIIEFMDDIGIPICEGYGLTETSPIITLNVPEMRKPGSVGRPLNGVTVVIAGEGGEVLPIGAEGEICCYGPNVMRGYYGNKEATDEVISVAPDGESRLFHTGDLGKIEADKFVYITGRIKEQFKLENGKYVCPTPIEEAIGMSRFIQQVVLCGANRPHNVALLVPDWVAIRTQLKIATDLTEEELVNDDRVRSLINSEIETTCKGLKKFEIPKDWALVAPFTAANNMLTPKMSVRRHIVMRAYESVIDGLYGHVKPVPGSADGSHCESEGETKVA